MLSDALDSLGTKSYTVKHRVPGGFDGHGRAQPVNETSSTITGMLQPFNGREVERQKEGLHAKELRTFFSAAALVVADHDASTIGDHVQTADGVRWEVVSVQDWTDLPDFAGFFEYTLSRVDA